MADSRKERSLRGQMAFIILLCWLLPMVLAAAVLGGYFTFGLGGRPGSPWLSSSSSTSRWGPTG